MINFDRIKAPILFLTIILLFSSCFDAKKIAYFQKAPNQSDTISTSRLYVPHIQTGDILSIYINSLSPEASSFFNPYTQATGAVAASSASTQSSTQGISTAPALTQSSSPGFLVDASGNIELPLIGVIKVSGLTTVDARDTIKRHLLTYLKEPTVTVRISNYKISVLGEVAKPAVYIIPNEQITLPEALSMAGDLTIFAKRNNIQIIRDVNGKKEFGTINLNSRDVFNSPYYYLHANDVVYVEPGKSKAQVNDRTYILVPSVVSLITAIILLTKN